MKLSALKGRVQKTRITIPSDGDEPEDHVNVEFKPGALTFDVIEGIQDLAGSGSDTKIVSELLHTVLVDWDLEEDIVDERGVPTGETRKLSCSIEDIRKVPLPFLGMVMEAITAEARGNPQRGATSDGSSQPTDSQDAPQTGSFS
jgi:hypothetical protein